MQPAAPLAFKRTVHIPANVIEKIYKLTKNQIEHKGQKGPGIEYGGYMNFNIMNDFDQYSQVSGFYGKVYIHTLPHGVISWHIHPYYNIEGNHYKVRTVNPVVHVKKYKIDIRYHSPPSISDIAATYYSTALRKINEPQFVFTNRTIYKIEVMDIKKLYPKGVNLDESSPPLLKHRFYQGLKNALTKIGDLTHNGITRPWYNMGANMMRVENNDKYWANYRAVVENFKRYGVALTHYDSWEPYLKNGIDVDIKIDLSTVHDTWFNLSESDLLFFISKVEDNDVKYYYHFVRDNETTPFLRQDVPIVFNKYYMPNCHGEYIIIVDPTTVKPSPIDVHNMFSAIRMCKNNTVGFAYMNRDSIFVFAHLPSIITYPTLKEIEQKHRELSTDNFIKYLQNYLVINQFKVNDFQIKYKSIDFVNWKHFKPS